MTAEPQVHVMPYSHRRIMFWSLFLFFVVILPIVVFYTSGYRVSITHDGERMITQTGGFFVGVFNGDVDLYINGEAPSDRRPFSSAYYVQGYEPGVYEVLTRGTGYETWVKELPVTEQIVTQAYAFNLPRIPQLRVIAPTTSETGVALIKPDSVGFAVLSTASTSNSFVLSTTTTATVFRNPEYEQLSRLFASTSAERAELKKVEYIRKELDQPFVFDSEITDLTLPTTTATSTVLVNDRMLYQKPDGEVYVRYTGDKNNTPHYFCLDYAGAATTSSQYGKHIYLALLQLYSSSTDPISPTLIGQRLCRDEIRIDRKWQEVKWFDFVPGNTDLVLMHLEDGLYVVEVDDRSWQNVQLLYPGTDFVALVDAGRIFVHDGDLFFEVFTDLIQ